MSLIGKINFVKKKGSILQHNVLILKWYIKEKSFLLVFSVLYIYSNYFVLGTVDSPKNYGT